MSKFTSLVLGLVVLALAGCVGNLSGGGCRTCVNEGTTGLGGPIVLTQGVGHAGSVAGGGVSYYQVTYALVGAHTITVNGMSGDVDPLAFTNNAFTLGTGTCTTNFGTTPETCTVTTAAVNTIIYIQVADWGSGATFTITP